SLRRLNFSCYAVTRYPPLLPRGADIPTESKARQDPPRPARNPSRPDASGPGKSSYQVECKPVRLQLFRCRSRTRQAAPHSETQQLFQAPSELEGSNTALHLADRRRADVTHIASATQRPQLF